MSEPHYTIKDLMARLRMSRGQIKGFIRRGDLHVEQHGGHGAAVTIPPAEAEAFIAFIEGTREVAPDPNRRRGAYCQDAPGGRCICRCHLMRAAKERSRALPRDAWLQAHDKAVTEMVAAGLSPERIATAISERFAVPRTAHAVRLRIRKLDLSTRDGWVSGEDLIRHLGVYRARIAWYEANGLLERADYGRWRRYSIASVDRLVQEQAGRTINPLRVRDPRWRSLAEVSAMANARTA